MDPIMLDVIRNIPSHLVMAAVIGAEYIKPSIFTSASFNNPHYSRKEEDHLTFLKLSSS